MKYLALLLFMFSSFTLSAKEDLSCKQRYRKSLAKKEKRYKKAYSRYKRNRNAAISGRISSDFGAQLIGSAYLQNTRAPLKSDFNMYEEDILKAAEADLDKYISIKPTVLEGIYNAAYEKYSDVTYEKIQHYINKGFIEDKFCGLLGKRRVPGIKRYVLRQLKKEGTSGSAVIRKPAVLNFKEDGKEGSYPDMDTELNQPLESKGRFE